VRKEGTCNLCGSCCARKSNWSNYLKPIGDYPFVVTDGCPNLLPPNENNQRKCAIYGTDKHWFWEDYCNGLPSHEKTVWDALIWFKIHPMCSLEYVED
jgi:hypothetical protein